MIQYLECEHALCSSYSLASGKRKGKTSRKSSLCALRERNNITTFFFPLESSLGSIQYLRKQEWKIKRKKEKKFPEQCVNFFYRYLMTQVIHPPKDVTVVKSGKVFTHKRTHVEKEFRLVFQGR